MPPPKFSLPSSLASHCRSLLSRPAAASTTTAARFISTTAPKPVPPNTPFSPAQFLEGLDRPSPSPSSPGRGGGGSGGGGGLRSNDEFWSMGGNRGGWRGGGNKPEPRREPAAADLIRMLAATSSMGSSQQQQAQRTAQARADAAEALRARDQNNAYVRHMPRRWAAGEVYSPHDLSPEEIGRYFKRELKPRFDVFDVLGFNPLDNYANFSVISEYITPMGRIKHRDETGLRPVNHRKMAKAIRRAIGLGLHPSVHRHPEIIHRLRRNVPARNSRFD
ncbi:hypothetical protein RB597_007343 [Gaeumannomyces tritici]